MPTFKSKLETNVWVNEDSLPKNKLPRLNPNLEQSLNFYRNPEDTTSSFWYDSAFTQEQAEDRLRNNWDLYQAVLQAAELESFDPSKQ